MTDQKITLNFIPIFGNISRSAQLSMVCKFDEHIVDSFISTISEDIEQTIKILSPVILWHKVMGVYSNVYDPSNPVD